MKMKSFLMMLVLLGIWLGINIVKDQPLFSNPFADGTLRDRANRAASNVVEKTRETIDRSFKGN